MTIIKRNNRPSVQLGGYFITILVGADRFRCALSIFIIRIFLRFVKGQTGVFLFFRRRLFLYRLRLRGNYLGLPQVFNTPSGAFLCTQAAGLTLIIIDDRIGVLDDDRLKLADLLALLTADTGVLTGLHCHLAHIAGGAANVHLFLL